MRHDFPDFCHHQSAKMIDYANDCTDPVLKDEFLQMSAYWLRITSVQSTVTTKQPVFKSSASWAALTPFSRPLSSFLNFGPVPF